MLQMLKLQQDTRFNDALWRTRQRDILSRYRNVSFDNQKLFPWSCAKSSWIIVTTACTCRLVLLFLACSLTYPQCSLYVQAWHRECYKCGDCMKRLDSTNCCEGPDKDIYCKGSFSSFCDHFQLRYCCYLTFIFQFFYHCLLMFFSSWF